MTMRIAIIGNSGSGKSTLARRIAIAHQVPLLELDAIVWEPQQTAVERASAAVKADLTRFLRDQSDWVVEGCYGELIELILPAATELVFLDLDEEICVANNRGRPWDANKYASKAAQDAMQVNLLSWVKSYYTRNDAWSQAKHRELYASHSGKKRVITTQPDLDALVASLANP